MSISKAAVLYANSLYDLAVEKDAVAGVTDEMNEVVKLIEANAELKQVLDSPIIKPSAKLIIIRESIQSFAGAVLMQFIDYIGKKNRIDGLWEIGKAYEQILDERVGIIRVKITSAIELTKEQLAEIQQQLEGTYAKKILFDTKIDPAVIGGFVLQVEDTVIDASLKNKLERLKKKFLKASLSFN
jgi:F-type H+-transporting ATPase subunit delta